MVTRAIRIAKIELPDGIEPSNRLICWKDDFDGSAKDYHIQITWLGINCGCYGRFHRQVAHIVDMRTVMAKDGK